MNNVVSNVEEFFTHKKEKLNEYNKCLSKEYSDDDLTDKLKEKTDELDAFFQKYSVSIGYEDTVTKFLPGSSSLTDCSFWQAENANAATAKIPME